MVVTIDGKARITNDTDEPQVIRRHHHICFARHTTQDVPVINPSQVPSLPSQPKVNIPYSHGVQLDPNNILEDTIRDHFQQALLKHDCVFGPDLPGYNGAAGSIEAHVNMGPVEPSQHKSRLPLYPRDKLIELLEKLDELEKDHVFSKPEEVDVRVEYLNPSFLVKKPSGGHRLVTAFANVGRYSKPQPSLMPDIDSTLRTIAPWKYIIKTDLSHAFYQIPLAKESRKYCGVATPFRGISVYCRSAMGMLSSETALEEMMCRVLGDFTQEGHVAKIADDLYCGSSSPEELLLIWTRVLD